MKQPRPSAVLIRLWPCCLLFCENASASMWDHFSSIDPHACGLRPYPALSGGKHWQDIHRLSMQRLGGSRALADVCSRMMMSLVHDALFQSRFPQSFCAHRERLGKSRGEDPPNTVYHNVNVEGRTYHFLHTLDPFGNPTDERSAAERSQQLRRTQSAPAVHIALTDDESQEASTPNAEREFVYAFCNSQVDPPSSLPSSSSDGMTGPGSVADVCPPSQENSKKCQRHAKRHKQGPCRFGDTCKYAHDDNVQPTNSRRFWRKAKQGID